MIPSTSRRAIIGAATASLSIALLASAASTTPAAAEPAAAPATAPAAAPEAAPAISPAEMIRSKYGMYPLPVKVGSVQKFKLKKRDLREIKSAKKLARSSTARMIRDRESGGNYAINTGNGYYGAYQFDRSTWLSNGGGRYASVASGAPSWAQDHIMWKTYQARGWSPWAM